MKRALVVAALMVAGSFTPTAAQADGSIGLWRWLGLGWGDGYHARDPHQTGHGIYGQPTGPVWNHHWHSPQEAAPALEPVPTVEPIPNASARQMETPTFPVRKQAKSTSGAAGPHFPKKVDSARLAQPVR